MQPSTLRSVLGHLRRLAGPANRPDLSDADLLERFRGRREEAAFTLLVQRHGPAVFGVCRRLLGDTPEAEDAFQATFLVLVRNAGTVRKQQSLASFLHGVASRIARKARSQSARRRQREQTAIPSPAPSDPLDALADAELRAALDEEIERLPAKYRTPLVLCYLAERTHEQAARELGWPKSSVTARLGRARDLLRQRLVRRGFTAPAGLLAVLLTEQIAAAVPALLTLSTVRLAVRAVRGETITVAASAALADGLTRGAAFTKVTAALTLLLTLGLAAALGHRLATVASPPAIEEPAAEAQPAEDSRPPKTEQRKPRVDLLGDPLPDGVVARMGSGRMRHPGLHVKLSFTPDGKSIVSGGSGCLRFWDAATGKLRRRFAFDGVADWCFGIAFGADGITVVSGSESEGIVTVQVLDPLGEKLRRRVEMPVRALGADPVLSRDGKWLALVHEKNDVRLFDTATGRETLLIPVRGDWVRELAFSPDGKTLAISDTTDTVRIHDTTSGKTLREFQPGGAMLFRLVFSPDGRFLAAISNPKSEYEETPGQIIIWDTTTGTERHRLKGPSRSLLLRVAFSPDSKYLAMGAQNDDLVLWDVATGREARRYARKGFFDSITYSPDGKAVAALSGGGAIQLWETATGRVLRGSADSSVLNLDPLHFSADGRRLLGGVGRPIAWDPNTGREIRRFFEIPIFKVPFRYYSARLSPDGSLLVDADRDGTIRLRDSTTGREVRVLKGHEKVVGYAVFSPDGRQLVSTGSDETIRVWDVATGRPLHKFVGGGDRTRSLVVSPDGRWLASSRHDPGPSGRLELTLWDLTAGREKMRLPPVQSIFIYKMAFSPDSRLLAAVGGSGRSDPGEVVVWDVPSGKQRYSLDGHKRPVLCVAFSPDGRTLATGAADGILFLWEMASGRKRHQFVGHESLIYSLAFSRDGKLLAASSAEAPAYTWDVRGMIERPGRPLAEEQLRRCWSDLAGEDATAAFQAIRRLASDPERSLPFLRQHLRPVPAPDLAHVRQLVTLLDSSDFQERQKAAGELEKRADAAASALRQTTKDTSSLYVRRTLTEMLDALATTPESLRAVRAVEALAWIGTPEAKRLLTELATGAPDARLTREATTARAR